MEPHERLPPLKRRRPHYIIPRNSDSSSLMPPAGASERVTQVGIGARCPAGAGGAAPRGV